MIDHITSLQCKKYNEQKRYVLTEQQIAEIYAAGYIEGQKNNTQQTSINK